jgi:hypothetical protein
MEMLAKLAAGWALVSLFAAWTWSRFMRALREDSRRTDMRHLLIAATALLLLTATPSFAAERPCGTHSWTNEQGKTPNGFTASATNGCHTYNWTSTIAQGPASGEVTFRTDINASGLADMRVGGDYCAARAAHEANLAFVHYFGVPDGTTVRVRYECK